jgi:hypothetical protein
MPKQPKYVDPTRPRTLFSRAYAGFSATRLGRFISAKIVWRIDPHLLRLTRGRFGMGLVLPTALLETRGAKSGARRRNAVIYFHDGDRVTIVASKAGHERHPRVVSQSSCPPRRHVRWHPHAGDGRQRRS